MQPGKHVSLGRFDISLFSNFYATSPSHEESSATAGRIADLITPEDGPRIVAEKGEGRFFVPCLLKTAPLVGKTLENAIKQGLPTIGKQRSGSHVTTGAWAKLDGDGLSEEQLAAIRATLNQAGIAYLIYSTHSHGREGKPGIRCRIIVFLDRTLDPAKYQRAVMSLSRRIFGQSLDASEARLHQQAGIWCAHPDRINRAFCFRQLDGLCVSTDGLLATVPKTVPTRIFINAWQLPLDAARIQEALKWIDPNEYVQWVKCALWLKAAYGDSAFPIWLGWSERADQEAQEQNDGRYAPDKIWSELNPTSTAEEGATWLFGCARNNAIATAVIASRNRNWDHRGKSALVYLRRFHHKRFFALAAGAA